MAANDSFSSSTSNLTYYSFTDTDSTALNSSSSSSRPLSQVSTEEEDLLYPFLGSVSSTSTNSETIVEEMSKCRSGLYDITVDISMDLSEDESFNKPDMLRAAVYTISGEIFFKHNEWRSISTAIAFHMGKALNPTSSIWVPVENTHLMYHGRTNITGHILTLAPQANPGIVYDTIEFSNYICATNVILDYSVEYFLSPAVAGADHIYRKSGFYNEFSHYDHKGKHMDDILRSHEARNLKVYNHHLAWGKVYNVFEEYRANVKRQNTFFENYGLSF